VTALVFLEINGVVDHDFDEAMLLQAMFYLAEARWTGTFFPSFCAKLFLEAPGRGRIAEPQ
jgi:hypothetical protein